MISDLFVILGMIRDLLTGGDPTLPAQAAHLWPIAWVLARIYDFLLWWRGVP